VAFDSRSQPIILLKPLGEELGSGRMLPIWIGSQEATSIVIAVEGAEAPRPLAHDLMKLLLETLGGSVERVEITRLEEGTFFADLTIGTPTGRRVLDARPSDAIALASRTETPIFVADAVLDEAGIPDESRTAPEDETKVEEFKEFLKDIEPEDFQG
jgi:bifunctional DNase/RNase